VNFFTYVVGLLGEASTYTGQDKQVKTEERGHISVLRAGFELKIAIFEPVRLG